CPSPRRVPFRAARRARRVVRLRLALAAPADARLPAPVTQRLAAPAPPRVRAAVAVALARSTDHGLQADRDVAPVQAGQRQAAEEVGQLAAALAVKAKVQPARDAAARVLSPRIRDAR